ncbi:MAG: hypothetical protein WDM96_12890 [Lacunisphaera sp.]
MKSLPLALAFLILPLAASADEVWPDADALPAASFPHEARHEVDLGKGVFATARFELTEKGNGGLTVPGYGLRVYDANRDGVTFKGYLLRCEWKDMNGDGYLDLVVSGTAQYWSEKDGHLDLEKPISAVLHYVPAQKNFTLLSGSPEIFTWANRETASARPISAEK